MTELLARTAGALRRPAVIVVDDGAEQELVDSVASTASSRACCTSVMR
ncbi:hypothetical protein [Nonomuraea sp. NPDC052265]